MARKPRKPLTLAQVAIQNAGFGQALLAFQFMMGWGMVEAKVGKGSASVDEYASRFDFDRATAYRHRAAFLKAFPGEESPSRLNNASGLQPRWAAYVKGLDNLASVYMESKAALFDLGSASYTPPEGVAS
jgi:hypothetical protein